MSEVRCLASPKSAEKNNNNILKKEQPCICTKLLHIQVETIFTLLKKEKPFNE